ncbi:MAG: Crp/Fnr family transcriptional regulator [Geminicoccales bacterium]|uniref:Crp/Fnr family transcriptional regulator n=1 Tax=Pelagimonas sp. TaxID=2073170 RepID=UPI003D6AE15C
MKPTDPKFDHCLAELRQSPFFAGLGSDVQADILGMFSYDTALRRDTNVSLLDADQRFSAVVSGRAKVSVYHPETGREHILDLLGPGDAFDLISLLDRQPRDVIVTALDDMEILTASQSQVRQWLLQHPEINRTFLPYLGEQMHRLADQAEDLALYDTEARLARLILRHITSNAPVHGLRLINDLSQETLASMIGSVRVVVGRQMSKWKQEGILSTGRGKWAIDDLNELIAKAQKKLDI